MLTFFQDWEGNQIGQAILYFLLMVWCFLGVAIIADTFMAAIEQITAATYVKKGTDGNKHVVKVWNPTVANLSLMALGSSAPEILLSVIEVIFGSDGLPFSAGDLGPSTIVGSAAFNLLVIAAVCVYAIGTVPKKIEQTQVYAITATFSILAYVWLVIVLMVSTPDMVTLWEAALTLALFPILILLAFAADKNWFRKSKDGEDAEKQIPDKAEYYKQNTKVFNLALYNNIKRVSTKSNVDDKIKLKMAKEALMPVTQATHRRHGLAWLTGKSRRAAMDDNGRLTRSLNTNTEGETVSSTASSKQVVPDTSSESCSRPSGTGDPSISYLKFLTETVEVLESKGPAVLVVTRAGSPEAILKQVSCEYATSDITATHSKDYVAAEGTLVFEPGEVYKQIEITIIDDDVFEKAETFRVCLSGPSPGAELSKRGKHAQVTIMNDDEKGKGAMAMCSRLCGCNQDKWNMIMEDWKDQFSVAFRVGAPGAGPPGLLNYSVHAITVIFKVSFAFVPPPAMGGGWVAFCVALAFIAIMTVLVGDLATLFGCAISLNAGTNAILFVALGTSMPDLFASKTAAQADENADNSIGNIVGSNSVNVFLGLGVPWLIAAAYWKMSGPTDKWLCRYKHNENVQDWLRENPGEAVFVVPADGLANSVIVFVICAIVCLVGLQVRRMVFGGELGGPFGPKVATTCGLCGLWGLYVVLSALANEDILPAIGGR